MKVATWNVNGIRARLSVLDQWLKTVSPDVLCVQELKCPDEKFPRKEFEKHGYSMFVCGQKKVNGVAILSKEPVVYHEKVSLNHLDQDEARLHWVHLKSGLKVINVYIPSGKYVGSDPYNHKLSFLSMVRTWMDKELSKEDRIILCGDFNVTPSVKDACHSENDDEKRLSCSTLERTALRDVIAWGFHDTYRIFEKDTVGYSYWDYRGGDYHLNLGYRIDHIYVSAALLPSCTSCVIDKEPRKWTRPSDHVPVMLSLSNKYIS